MLPVSGEPGSLYRVGGTVLFNTPTAQPPHLATLGTGPIIRRHLGVLFKSFHKCWELPFLHITLLGINLSHQKSLLKMLFLFPRWDMLVPWRVFFVGVLDGGFIFLPLLEKHICYVHA